MTDAKTTTKPADCPKGGSFTGPCMPSLLRAKWGRCIWCERELPRAGA